MTQHAKLSASGSARWINCPGSIKASEDYPRTSNSFADEGTLAHDLAEYCITNFCEPEDCIGKTLKQLGFTNSSFAQNHQIEKEMANYVQEYISYVLSHETIDSKTYIEEQVRFDNVVPDGFGTSDAIIISPSTRICHIFDLKYGKGVRVDSYENTQGQMYALGVLNEFGFLDMFDSIRIHIVQPRMYNFSYWDISKEDLIKFGKFVSERAKLALTDDAPRIAGNKQCEWCPAKGDCKALANFTETIIMADFESLEYEDPQKLTDQDRKLILDNAKLIKDFIKEVETDCYSRALAGDKIGGYKLVEGRSNRKWKEGAEVKLKKLLKGNAFKKSLIGLTEAKPLIGEDMINELTIKPEAPLALVPENHKGKEVFVESVEDDFDEL